jgi:hypothetical protein
LLPKNTVSLERNHQEFKKLRVDKPIEINELDETGGACLAVEALRRRARYV